MSHTHFSLLERQTIEQMLEQQASQAAIARLLGKSRSAVCRELKRNKNAKKYNALDAHQQANERKALAAAVSNSQRTVYMRKKPIAVNDDKKKPEGKSKSPLLFPASSQNFLTDRKDNRKRNRKAPLLPPHVMKLIKRIRPMNRDYLMEAVYDQRDEFDKKRYCLAPRPEWKTILRFRMKTRNYGPRKDLTFKHGLTQEQYDKLSMHLKNKSMHWNASAPTEKPKPVTTGSACAETDLPKSEPVPLIKSDAKSTDFRPPILSSPFKKNFKTDFFVKIFISNIRVNSGTFGCCVFFSLPNSRCFNP
jgi:hypothetical protein